MACVFLKSFSLLVLCRSSKSVGFRSVPRPPFFLPYHPVVAVICILYVFVYDPKLFLTCYLTQNKRTYDFISRLNTRISAIFPIKKLSTKVVIKRNTMKHQIELVNSFYNWIKIFRKYLFWNTMPRLINIIFLSFHAENIFQYSIYWNLSNGIRIKIILHDFITAKSPPES